jgi:PilZ domain-containing protein
MLRDFLSRNKTPQLVDRDGDRYEVSLRVLSRELPGYRGVTLDLSRTGVQLETSGILEVGSEPTLKFEFDRGELESFECRAKVVWSRKEDSRRDFHSGLVFLPETNDEKRQLARMATVLQTRSETDLKTLLDQARRIDPELERDYAAMAQAKGEIAPVPPPPPIPAKSKRVQAASQAAPVESQPRHPGLYIPMNVVLEGYTWNRSSRTLHLGLAENGQTHSLYFPNCQLFQVMEPASDQPIVGLYSTITSPSTRRLDLGGSVKFKHYRFVTEGGQGLVDIVSEACKCTV